MRYTAFVLAICMLFVGIGGARANELELGIDQRSPVSIDFDALGDQVGCPSAADLNEVRQRLARENTTTAAYKAAMGNYVHRGLGCWLRVFDSPEGRGYLARVEAAMIRRLQLQCGCAEGAAFVIIDQGGGPALGAYFGQVSGPVDPMAVFNFGPALPVMIGLLALGQVGINQAVRMGLITQEMANVLLQAIGIAAGGLAIVGGQGALAVQRAGEREQRDPEGPGGN